MDENIKRRILVVIVLLLIGSIIAYFYIYRGYSRNFIELEGLYDSNHKLISHGFQSVVGGVEGVKYVRFTINVENGDQVPLNLYIVNMTPSEIEAAVPTEKYNIYSGGMARWTTGFIDIEPYQGVIQDFCATVNSDPIPFLRPGSSVKGCLSLKIDESVLNSDFDIQIDSGTGNNILNPGCNETWVCSDWDMCSSGGQKRNCADLNKCGTTLLKPLEEQICITPEQSLENATFTTNSDGNYKNSNVWVMLNDRKYFYNGYSTYQCLDKDIITHTNEGFPICTKEGYEITRRIYIQQGGYGLIFKP